MKFPLLLLAGCATAAVPRQPDPTLAPALACESRCDLWAIGRGTAIFAFNDELCCCALIPAPESSAQIVRECFDKWGRLIAPLVLASCSLPKQRSQ